MSSPTTQVVRPAGAGHETLNVLLLCLLILAVAGSVVAWRGVSHEPEPVASNQYDARRDLSAAEQGIYADLRVTLDEIRLLREEQKPCRRHKCSPTKASRRSRRTPVRSAVVVTHGRCSPTARISAVVRRLTSPARF